MTTALSNNSGTALPNPSRSQIHAFLAKEAPGQDVDIGLYDMSGRYDRDAVLARLPGNDLQSISDSATKDAAECSKSARRFFVWALPVWIVGLVNLFPHGAAMAVVAALVVGTLGIAGGVRKLVRSNHDRILLNEIHRLFPATGAEHHR